MIRLLWTASAEVRYFLRCYMPSNILLDLIRTRKGLKWGVPAMLLAGPYLAIAFWCTTLIENGGPGWLHLVVLVCLWNALKMMAIGPVSVVSIPHLLGGNFALHAGQGKALVAGGFHRAGFMYIDMPAVGTQHAPPGF